jgi:hypothetical protein
MTGTPTESTPAFGPATRTTIGVTMTVGLAIATVFQIYGAQMTRLATIERDMTEMRAEVRQVRDLLLREFRATQNQRDNP